MERGLDSRPSQRAWAPVAIMTVSARNFCSGIEPGPKRPARKIHFGHQIVDNFRADMLGLFGHLFHQPRALDGFGEAGIVLHVGGDGQLAPRLQSGHQNRLQIGARGINSCGVTGGTGANDQNPGSFNVTHARKSVACALPTYLGFGLSYKRSGSLFEKN